jgi:hypothetical protein
MLNHACSFGKMAGQDIPSPYLECLARKCVPATNCSVLGQQCWSLLTFFSCRVVSTRLLTGVMAFDHWKLYTLHVHPLCTPFMYTLHLAYLSCMPCWHCDLASACRNTCVISFQYDMMPGEPIICQSDSSLFLEQCALYHSCQLSSGLHQLILKRLRDFSEEAPTESREMGCASRCLSCHTLHLVQR